MINGRINLWLQFHNKTQEAEIIQQLFTVINLVNVTEQTVNNKTKTRTNDMDSKAEERISELLLLSECLLLQKFSFTRCKKKSNSSRRLQTMHSTTVKWCF